MLFIVNPISGNGNKTKIVNTLKERGYKVVSTQYAGHGEVLAREAAEEKIIAIGGDGTVNEIARGIMGSNKTLGIIPCGSGDGLALHLGISRNFENALKTIINGKTAPLDGAMINGRLFLSVCGVGFDALVSEQFAKSGKRGLFNYIKQGLKLWKDFKPESYKINIDGKEWTQPATLITIGNSDQWGNQAKITPLADSQDGLLDITIADSFNTFYIPSLAGLLMTGHLDKSNKIHCYKGKHITISRNINGPVHADGDWFESGEVIDIEIIPAAFRVIIP